MTFSAMKAKHHRSAGIAHWPCVPNFARYAVGLCLFASMATADPAVTGSISTENGVRVLRLWGTDREQGYAHGYLLGRDIMDVVESVLLDERTLADPNAYEKMILGGVVAQMKFEEAYEQQLSGMLAGVKAAVGADGIQLRRLKRDLSVQDLKAINTLADWSQFFCSSVSVWGERTAGGEMITARNLDFATLKGLRERHVMIVYLQPGKDRERWVSVAWPSLIGAYSAMNEEGVTISIHDVAVAKPKQPAFVPRSIALREAIETASAATAVADVKAVLERSTVLCGNNVHVSSPFRGQSTPAAVFEYDGDEGREGGVTLRTSADGSEDSTSLLCTNHYRKRGEPASCSRFDALRRTTAEWQSSKQKVSAEAAFEAMKGVEQRNDRAFTLQTIVYLPNRLELWLALATPDRTSAQSPIHKFRLAELLDRR